ncbi:MAG: hypothetical protein KGY65_01355 [Candidatus Thermoplasmatota archaeon]|nr:hypothetical protein [Candidatus Thermoplasmatota archaeon]
MTKSITMEGSKRKIIKITNKISKHPHTTVLCLLLLISILVNSMMISFLGLSTFIDSFNHPSDYILLSSDQIKDSSSKIVHGTAVIQKQSHPSFSMNETESLCIENTQGTYIICSQTTQSIVSKHTTQSRIVGKVITLIPDIPLSKISCLWWQQTIQIIKSIELR